MALRDEAEVQLAQCFRDTLIHHAVNDCDCDMCDTVRGGDDFTEKGFRHKSDFNLRPLWALSLLSLIHGFLPAAHQQLNSKPRASPPAGCQRGGHTVAIAILALRAAHASRKLPERMACSSRPP